MLFNSRPKIILDTGAFGAEILCAYCQKAIDAFEPIIIRGSGQTRANHAQSHLTTFHSPCHQIWLNNPRNQ